MLRNFMEVMDSQTFEAINLASSWQKCPHELENGLSIFSNKKGMILSIYMQKIMRRWAQSMLGLHSFNRGSIPVMIIKSSPASVTNPKYLWAPPAEAKISPTSKHLFPISHFRVNHHPPSPRYLGPRVN